MRDILCSKQPGVRAMVKLSNVAFPLETWIKQSRLQEVVKFNIC